MKIHSKSFALAIVLLLIGMYAQAQTPIHVTGEYIENVYIPPGSDDTQNILIIGDLVCGSSIGVTKTKKWDDATDIPYGAQGEHTYETDDHLSQVRTAIAKVEPASPTRTWAKDAYHKRIFFDDKDYYRVWSFNYSNSDNTDKAYSDQKDYFIETWRSFADEAGFSGNTVSTEAGFAYFAKQVNNGITISNANQNATINLAGHYWEPRGYTFCADCDNEPDVPFDGIYNGNGHFILNAISILPEKEMGLFGNVTGTVKHTFAVGNLFANTHDHASNNHGSAGLGAIVGSTTGTIDGCEAARFTLKGYATNSGATLAAGGIAGNVGASGEVRNSFTSAITFDGSITNAGGLVGEIASGGAVKNCYSKADIPTSGNTKGALVGKSAGLLSNAYTSATTGAIVGSGTQGTNVYSAGASGQTDTYTPTIGADHLGYMCIDNGVTTFNKTGLIEGKDYYKFHDGSSEVELMPLFRLLNLNAKALNSGAHFTTYSEWARPALAYYNSSFNGIERPINGDLPLLMLNNYNVNVIGQGGFRSVGTYGGSGDVLQYGGPDRDGNVLDAALTRPKVTGTTGNDYLFVYGDVDVAPAAQLSAFTQAKVSIFEHASIRQAGTLAGFNQTYVGITFDNSKSANGTTTNGINFITQGPTLPRNWHIISTPVSNAPLGFYYPGNQNSNLYTTGNYNSSNFFNNPWGNEAGANSPNSPSANEFSWLNGGSAGHNRYWMYGWDNSRVAGTHDDSSYPANTWVDGYFPSKVNTSAIQFGKQLFIEADGQNGSNEYVGGNHRYPYGMDLYSWYEPMYHYINFKRNGPNHWHSDLPHVHLDYTPEQASNNAGVFGTNVNETTLLDCKGYMASIHIPTFLQTSGALGTPQTPGGGGDESITVYRVGVVSNKHWYYDGGELKNGTDNPRAETNHAAVSYVEHADFAKLDQKKDCYNYEGFSYLHNLKTNDGDLSGIYAVGAYFEYGSGGLAQVVFDNDAAFWQYYASNCYPFDYSTSPQGPNYWLVQNHEGPKAAKFIAELLFNVDPSIGYSISPASSYSIETNDGKTIELYEIFFENQPVKVTHTPDGGAPIENTTLYAGRIKKEGAYWNCHFWNEESPLHLFVVEEQQKSNNDAPMAKSNPETRDFTDIEKSIAVTYNRNELRLCEGWNLVGNPFHSYLDFNEFCKDNPGVNNTYIVYNSDRYGSTNTDPTSGSHGNGFTYYVNNGSIGGAYAHRHLHPHQGFFVRVKANQTLTFKESHASLRKDLYETTNDGSYRDDFRPTYPLVNLFLSSDKGCSDVCVVEFNRPEWGGASKLRDMYSGNGMFYATHDDANYAALFATPDVNRIPIKFEAKDEAGDNYTISWNTKNGDFNKLYLVDNITGVQYDMLRNSSYSFRGKKTDYWSRFYITFDLSSMDVDEQTDDDTNSGNNQFAFFDGSQWVVTNNGNGSAQLDFIDMLGRVLHSTTLSEGQTRISLPNIAKGLYLLRMTNQNGMFVQKIVVK